MKSNKILNNLLTNAQLRSATAVTSKLLKAYVLSAHSDDLMRHLDGVGVEWGNDWVIKHILQEELTPVDTDEAFEESVRQCYPEEVTVGWITVDTVEALKSQDPTSWRIARDEWISTEEERNILSFDNGQTYYHLHDIESLIE